jgi:hypothetical protein
MPGQRVVQELMWGEFLVVWNKKDLQSTSQQER